MMTGARSTSTGRPPASAGLRWLDKRPAAGLRLFCFPWAGAGASVYRRLVPFLPSAIEPVAVQLPGREERYREAPLLEMDAIVTHVVRDLFPHLDKPFAFMGHSMGALVAYEAALRLRDCVRVEPDLLVVSGCNAPGSGALDGYRRCPATADDVTLMADIELMGGTPAAVLRDRQMLSTLLPVVRADYTVLDRYRPRPAKPLTSRLAICGAAEDISTTEAALLAWNGLFTQPGEYQLFEGGHFFLNEHPQPFGRRLAQWMTDASISLAF